MNEQLKKVIRSWSQRRVLQILVLAVVGILFYVFMSQEWLSIETDSAFYLNPRREGVMPVYPLFIFAVKCIFGENLYLDAVVVIQSVLAAVCTMVFVLYLQEQFQLKFIETILLYVASMLPFSIYLPEVGITHQILTEGLAYAFFYLYFILLLQYVFTQKIRWLLSATAMAAFMELIRSQMLFLLGVTAAVFVCVEFVKSGKDKISRRIIRTGANCVVGVIGILVMISLVYKIYGWYWIHQVPVIENSYQKMVASQTESQESITVEDEMQQEKSLAESELNVTSSSAENYDTMSQFTTLIIIRGIYEIDEDDIELFDSPEMKEIFQRVFNAVDAKQSRYVYARQDLYMWKDLVKDKIPYVVIEHVNAYLGEHPEVGINNVQICRELGMKALIHHFDRYLYHSFRMMISGFISSVFFQIERIYLLCHFITLLLYLIAAAGIIYCLKKGGNRKVAAFAITTLGYIFLMVVTINLVFMGLQRYMVYAMGIFYCSQYLLMKESLLITAERFPNNRLLAVAANVLGGQADKCKEIDIGSN